MELFLTKYINPCKNLDFYSIKMTNSVKKNILKKGAFITFEGPEGAGKSTQIKLLSEYLEKMLPANSLIITREPGGTELSEHIRNIVKHHQGNEPLFAETEVLLFAASRAQHVRNLILPAIGNKKIVLCDRFFDSTTAYQGYARGFPLDFIANLNNFASCGVSPDITFLLDISPEAGLKRAKTRAGELFANDRLENEKIDFHRKVRNGFLKIAGKETDRIKVIDADNTPDAIHSKIKDFINVFIEKL